MLEDAGFLLFNPRHCTPLILTLSGCKRTGGLTNIVLYSDVLLSQKTRPDALLSLKFPQPKLPVKTLLGEEEREKKGGVMRTEMTKNKVLFCN